MEIKELNLKKYVIKTLSETKGYKELTPIQQRIIPLAIEGKNLIGKSATGSGKTDAFLAPAFNLIDETVAEVMDILRAEFEDEE